MDVDPINGADGGQIAQPIQSWADQRRSAISIIDKLSLGRHRCAVAFGALAERCCLTFNRVRGRLLFAGDARVERGSKCCHKKPPRGGWEINWPQASTGSVGTEFNFERRITMSETSTLISCTGRITRAELAKLPTPPATETHIPIPHAAVVETLVEILSHRQIAVVGEEFAVSKDDMEMFGVLDLETRFEGCRFAIGIRNANNPSLRRDHEKQPLWIPQSFSPESPLRHRWGVGPFLASAGTITNSQRFYLVTRFMDVIFSCFYLRDPCLE